MKKVHTNSISIIIQKAICRLPKSFFMSVPPNRRPTSTSLNLGLCKMRKSGNTETIRYPRVSDQYNKYLRRH